MKPVVSPKELAEAIGVSESSVKRWVDDGRITASRTEGGHRRIPIEEAVNFIRKTQAPIVRPELLGIGDLDAVESGRRPLADAPDRLLAALGSGQAREARGVITSLFLAGHSLATICDGPVAEAMARIGALWREREDGIYVEHRATDICVQAMTQLRQALRPADDAPIAVGGAVSGDPYLLPSMAAAAVLAEQGFRAINLGPESPVETLRHAVEENDARICWVSVSVATEPERLASELTTFADWLEKRDVRGIIGGREAGALEIPTDRFYRAARMSELAAFASGLIAGR